MRTARATVLAFVVALAAVAAVTTGAGAVGSDIGATSGVGDRSNVADASAGVSNAAERGAQCEYPDTATDTTGTEVTVEEAPERIVTLAPSAAQTLWELGASEKVVGVTDNAMYLDGADEKTVVAEGTNYETETIIGLEPDLVIAPNVVSNDTVETLRSNDPTVYRFAEAGSFEGVYEKVSVIGELSGECEAAEATVTDMRQRVEAIREAVSDEERPGSMYVFFGFTAGNGTFIDDILETAGTTNVAGEVGISGYAEVNDEVIANNSEEIEWLVFNSDEASHPSGGVYDETTAMKENQTVVLNVNYLNQPAPRTVLALENLTRAVHPEAYAEAQENLATPTATATPTDTATASPTNTAAGGPGFGLVAGVLALLAVALLGRRQ